MEIAAGHLAVDDLITQRTRAMHGPEKIDDRQHDHRRDNCRV